MRKFKGLLGVFLSVLLAISGVIPSSVTAESVIQMLVDEQFDSSSLNSQWSLSTDDATATIGVDTASGKLKMTAMSGSKWAKMKYSLPAAVTSGLVVVEYKFRSDALPDVDHNFGTVCPAGYPGGDDGWPFFTRGRLETTGTTRFTVGNTTEGREKSIVMFGGSDSVKVGTDYLIRYTIDMSAKTINMYGRSITDNKDIYNVTNNIWGGDDGSIWYNVNGGANYNIGKFVMWLCGGAGGTQSKLDIDYLKIYKVISSLDNAPSLVSSTINNNDTDVAVSHSTVELNFDKALDPATITKIKLKKGNTEIPVTATLDGLATKCTLSWSGQLDYDSNYVINIPTSVSGGDGTPLKTEYAIQFTTQAVPAPFSVLSSTIIDGNNNVPLGTNSIGITFNRKASQSSLAGITLNASGTSVAINTSLDTAGTLCTITAQSSLEPGKNYVLTIPQTVCDVNDVALDQVYTVHFMMSPYILNEDFASMPSSSEWSISADDATASTQVSQGWLKLTATSAGKYARMKYTLPSELKTGKYVVEYKMRSSGFPDAAYNFGTLCPKNFPGGDDGWPFFTRGRIDNNGKMTMSAGGTTQGTQTNVSIFGVNNLLQVSKEYLVQYTVDIDAKKISFYTKNLTNNIVVTDATYDIWGGDDGSVWYTQNGGANYNLGKIVFWVFSNGASAGNIDIDYLKIYKDVPMPGNVTYCSIINGSTNVPISTNSMLVSFDKAIDPNTISNIVLKAGNAQIPITHSLDASGTTCTLSINQPLTETTLYTLIIPVTVKDTEGIPIGSEYTSTFTTGVHESFKYMVNDKFEQDNGYVPTLSGDGWDTVLPETPNVGFIKVDNGQLWFQDTIGATGNVGDTAHHYAAYKYFDRGLVTQTLTGGNVVVEYDFKFSNFGSYSPAFPAVAYNGSNSLIQPMVQNEKIYLSNGDSGQIVMSSLAIGTWYRYRLMLNLDVGTYSAWLQNISDPTQDIISKTNLLMKTVPAREIKFIQMQLSSYKDAPNTEMRMDNFKVYRPISSFGVDGVLNSVSGSIEENLTGVSADGDIWVDFTGDINFKSLAGIKVSAGGVDKTINCTISNGANGALNRLVIKGVDGFDYDAAYTLSIPSTVSDTLLRTMSSAYTLHFSTGPETRYPVVVSNLVFTDSDDNVLTKLQGTTLKVTADITNLASLTTREKSVCLILVLKNGNGKIINISNAQSIIAGGTAETLSSEFSLPSSLTNCKAEVYVWNDLSHCMPISKGKSVLNESGIVN